MNDPAQQTPPQDPPAQSAPPQDPPAQDPPAQAPPAVMEGLGIDPNWKSALPKAIADLEIVKTAKTPDQVADQHRNLESMIGRRLPIVATEDAPDVRERKYQRVLEEFPDLMRRPDPSDPERMAEVYTQLGRPETPSEYTRPELPAEVDLAPGALDALLEAAHQAGLTQSQVDSVLATELGRQAAVKREAIERHNNARTELERSWGEARDDNYAMARELLVNHGFPDEVLQALDDRMMPPSFLASLVDLARSVAASNISNKEGQQLVTTATASAARMKDPIVAGEEAAALTRKMQSPAYLTENPPQSRQYKIDEQRRVELYAKATGQPIR